MKVTTAPEPLPLESDPSPKIFLAGSIENGTASDWQTEIIEMLAPFQGILINPRRRNWDPTWDQAHPELGAQIRWELKGITECDMPIFYFDPATKSPITLAELGIIAGIGTIPALVCCPNGFWRQRNVEEICDFAQLDYFTNRLEWEEAILHYCRKRAEPAPEPPKGTCATCQNWTGVRDEPAAICRLAPGEVAYATDTCEGYTKR